MYSTKSERFKKFQTTDIPKFTRAYRTTNNFLLSWILQLILNHTQHHWYREIINYDILTKSDHTDSRFEVAQIWVEHWLNKYPEDWLKTKDFLLISLSRLFLFSFYWGNAQAKNAQTKKAQKMNNLNTKYSLRPSKTSLEYRNTWLHLINLLPYKMVLLFSQFWKNGLSLFIFGCQAQIRCGTKCN